MEIPKQQARGGSYDVELETDAQAAVFGAAWGRLGEAWIGYRKEADKPLTQRCSPHTLNGIYKELTMLCLLTDPATLLPSRRHPANHAAFVEVTSAVAVALRELPPKEIRSFVTISDDLLPTSGPE